MKSLALIFVLFAVVANACDEQEKPALIIEKDFLEESADYCGYYLLTVPSKYKNADVHSFSLRHGETLGFNLAVLLHDDEMRSMAAICASSEWLKEAKLTVTYKEPPNADGSIPLCIEVYEYKNLSQFITGH